MFILTIVLSTTIGISQPVVLTGKPYYHSLQECQKAGDQVVNWLTQDFVTVQYTCEEVKR